jgi:hypothetical protein
VTALRWGLAASGWPALAATALPPSHPLRVIVTTVFLLLCPGLATGRPAWLRALRGARPTVLLEAFVLAVMLSLALSALVAEAFFLSDAFTPGRALLALAVITSALALTPRRGDMRPRGRRVPA